ncbi:sigma-54-dependent Fis family transcriptional regulator [Rhizobium dioscoreae]|uniref:sigma-54-dependent transcriptional regulator n=1 Tax=Rhizobium TaxID=379 RepID=UPI00119AE2B2|nr:MULTISPECIES: sigma-54 dependent transcriptional regulator [Rhizobium]MCZ3377130.1 sigma-54-dependent Fis family transcriptional regulator [Rhizobium sp. AG207R]TWB12710.1 two-component system C4-dicarboxylate transport response regulator DctD [Rhizobium sp. ERR1071]GES41877.1 sigma-54-dependent Fis family transcriptional regulator [Rhizobium dioscoreae]
MTLEASQKILLVEDDGPFNAALTDSFVIAGFDVETHGDGQSALASLATALPGVIVSDIRLPRIDGHDLLEAVLARDPDLPVILMTGHGDIAMAVGALKQGAYDFIAKPFATDHLIASVRRALETRRLVLENRRLRQAAAEAEDAAPLLGQTAVMARLRETIRQVANADVDVLIEGETGTGKELVARLIHRWSRRRARSFVSVDCASLPDAIADEVLFGNRARRGRIAEADRGTLFLDEIDSMSPMLQGRLLRVAEERELPSVSGESTPVDLRIVAATKNAPHGSVAENRVRADLLYRLETVRIRIPPLRERRADIGLLFSAFLDEAARLHGVPRPPIDAAMEARFLTDDWLGNVRELRNYAIQVALGLASARSQPSVELGLSDQMDHFEANILRATLERYEGDISEVAQALKLPRRSLYARLQRHGINPSAYRK